MVWTHGDARVLIDPHYGACGRVRGSSLLPCGGFLPRHRPACHGHLRLMSAAGVPR
jgi:hypothetical protein